MRSIAAKLVLAAAITSIGMFAADNLIGTWKRNIAKSTSTPAVPNPIKSLTLVYEAADGGVKLTATGERQDGEKILSTATVKYDGKDYPATGAPWDTLSMKQIDANTFTGEARKSGSKYHMKTRTVVSNGGKTLTMTSKGTNAEGQPATAVAVYDKQ